MNTLQARIALRLGTLMLMLVLAASAAASGGPGPRHLYGLAAAGSIKSLVPFDVSASGVLTERPNQSVPVPRAARTIVVGRDARTVYVGATQGFSGCCSLIPGTINVFSVADDGSLTLLQTVVAPPRQMALSPNGSRLFEWDDYGLVVSFPILSDGSLGTAVANPNVTGSARAIAFAPDGETLYAATYPQQLQQYAVAADGSLTARSLPEVGIFGCHADWLGSMPDGSRLDAFCYNQGITLALAEHGLAFDGSLFTTWGGSATAEDVRGRGVYRGIDPNAIQQMLRLSDGSLAYVTPLIFDSANVSGVATDPAGDKLVVANSGHLIETYAIATDGSLSANPVDGASTTLNSLSNLTYGPDQPPVAALHATQAGTTAHFDATPSNAVNGTIVRYDWTFGDGAALTDGGPTPTHTYAASGDYTAKVTLTDSAGCSVAETYTGVVPVCAGSASAAAAGTVHVVADAVPPPGVTSPPAAGEPPVPSSPPVTPREAPATPKASETLVEPRSLTGAPSVNGSAVRLSWTPAAGAPVSRRYLIAWSPLHSAQGPSDPNMRHIWTTNTHLLLAGERPGTTLHYAVYAYGSDGRLAKAGKTTIRLPR